VNPDVAAAVPELVEQGVLAPEQAALLLRASRGELCSIRGELRALLYAGVALVMAGVGLLVKENLDRIGPVTIALAIGLAACACLGWVVKTALPFSWTAQPSPHIAFDYLLLLGALLVAADLAYIEVKFVALGANWPWHLLIVAAFAAALALRFDSRVLFSLALTTLAAWRGVSLSLLGRSVWRLDDPAVLRWNAIGCGVLFVALGWSLLRAGRKPHFEPAAAHLGWLLVLGGLASGALAEDRAGTPWPAFAFALLLAAGGLGAGALRYRRFSLFALGVVGAYVAVSRFAVAGMHDGSSAFAWFCLSSIACIVGLVVAQRRMRGPA
jgi:hypothetical protein